MGLEVIAPGHFTTLQDRGRPGYAAWGVPRGGAFDRASLELANALLGNDPDCAALEMTLLGGTFRAQIPLAIALAGAPMEAVIESQEREPQRLLIPLCCTLKAGETLRIGGTPVGARTYLAVRGGWLTSHELASRSRENPIQVGQVLAAAPSETLVRHPQIPVRSESERGRLRVLDGPDVEQALGFEEWLGGSFRVDTQANRMGLRIVGPALSLRPGPERASMPVSTGAIQVAGGQLIILGVACGTIGGYPHVAHVISADLDQLAQLRPGDPLRFSRIELAAARRIDDENRRFHKELHQKIAALTGDVVTRPTGD